MVDTTQELLYEAIARNSAAVLSLPTAGMLRHNRTRFLAIGEGGFYLESIAGETELIDSLIISQLPVGVAFKTGNNKIVFAVPIWKRQPDFRLNKELCVEGLLLPFPQSIKSIQRRTAYRVQIPSSCDINVRIWRIAEHAVLRDRPSASMEVPVNVRDISVGGMGVLCPPKDDKPANLTNDQRLRIVIRYGVMEAMVEGRVRHALPTPDKSIRLGVQFRKLEDDLEGRQALGKLTAIVGELHRAEVRRVRLGLSA